MDMRKLLVVASAAVIVTGSSFAAFASQRHHGSGVSKGESSSSAHLKVRADPRNPECQCIYEVRGRGHGQSQNEEGTELDIWADSWQKATAPKGGEAKASSFAGGIGYATEWNNSNNDNGYHADTYAPNSASIDGGSYNNNNHQTGSTVAGAVLVGGSASAGD